MVHRVITNSDIREWQTRKIIGNNFWGFRIHDFDDFDRLLKIFPSWRSLLFCHETNTNSYTVISVLFIIHLLKVQPKRKGPLEKFVAGPWVFSTLGNTLSPLQDSLLSELVRHFPGRRTFCEVGCSSEAANLTNDKLAPSAQRPNATASLSTDNLRAIVIDGSNIAFRSVQLDVLKVTQGPFSCFAWALTLNKKTVEELYHS